MAMTIMEICLHGLVGDMGVTGIVGDIYAASCGIFITAASRVVSCGGSVCFAASEPCETARWQCFAQAHGRRRPSALRARLLKGIWPAN
jgi:hypothetical protein